MKSPIRLLFTNEDQGHFFEDDFQAMALIAKIAKQEWKLKEHFETGTIGGSTNERTDSSSIPHLYRRWRYVYVIDARTYTVIYAILDALLNVPEKV